MGISRTWCQSGEFVLECENIQNNIQNENSVYVTLLDEKKAFDSVWHNGIFY